MTAPTVETAGVSDATPPRDHILSQIEIVANHVQCIDKALSVMPAFVNVSEAVGALETWRAVLATLRSQDEVRQQLAEMRRLLVDAEAMLCDERAGPAANELASRILAALAPTSQPSRGKCPYDCDDGTLYTPQEPCPHCQPSRHKPHCNAAERTPLGGDMCICLIPDCAQPSKSTAKRIAAQQGEPYPFEQPERQGQHTTRAPLFIEGVSDPSPPQDDIVAGLRNAVRSAYVSAFRKAYYEQEKLKDDEQVWAMAESYAIAYLEPREDRLRAIAALSEKGCTRETVIRECWDAINKYIKQGPLPGNGCDESAQRNGMVLATNVLMEMMERGK